MNRRQIKKRVKQAKLKKERGMILSPEEQHYIRNYRKCYYTKTENADFTVHWDKFIADTQRVVTVVERVREYFADMFQSWADALKRNGGAE